METNAVTLRYINIYTRIALKGNDAWKGFLYSFSQQIEISVCVSACVSVCVCVRHYAKSCHINCKQLGSVEPSTKQTPKAVMRQADKKIETGSEERKEAEKER